MPSTRAQPSTQALIEPRAKMNQQILEQLLTLDPTHPEYPAKYPFENIYEAAGGKPEIYPLKHALAVALISDPQDRYPHLRFLEKKFVLKGREITPEIQALKDDLKRRVRDALVKRANKNPTVAEKRGGGKRPGGQGVIGNPKP